MAENERKAGNTAEYTFIDRNIRRKSEKEGCSAVDHPLRAEDGTEEFPEEPFGGENEPAVSGRTAAKPRRSAALLLAIQTVLAVLLLAGAAAIRLIDGETGQQIAQEYYRLTESGAVDLKSLFAPIASESGTDSKEEPAQSLSPQGSEPDASADGSRSVPAQEGPAAPGG